MLLRNTTAPVVPRTAVRNLFVPRVNHLKKIPLPLDKYPKMILPPGMLTVWEPEIIPNDQLQKLAESDGASFGMVRGLTLAKFSTTFPVSPNPWPTVGPDTVQFRGDVVNLNLDLIIYVSNVIDQFKNRDDAFQLIVQHELKHWREEVDLVTNFMPKQLLDHPDIVRLLVDDGMGRSALLSNQEYREWFVDPDPANAKGSKFENIICKIWEDEHDRRTDMLDSSAEYFNFSAALGSLRHNMPFTWPK